jgi:integrase
MRRRLAGLLAQERTGIRSTEITVSRINTAAEWLRDQKKIPRDAAVLPKKWRADLLKYWSGETAKVQGLKPEDVKDPEVHRPRHTLEDMRKVLAAAPRVDPRLQLLLQLAAEYRLGQARTAKRSHVDRAAGTFRIFGRGKKGGAVINLTDGQAAAWDVAVGEWGYLYDLERAWLEDRTDYYLFPSGKMLGRKKGTWTLGRASTPEAREPGVDHQELPRRRGSAGVKKIKGGAAYLLRRQNVDAMNEVGISGLGKQAPAAGAPPRCPTRSTPKAPTRPDAKKRSASAHSHEARPAHDAPARYVHTAYTGTKQPHPANRPDTA